MNTKRFKYYLKSPLLVSEIDISIRDTGKTI